MTKAIGAVCGDCGAPMFEGATRCASCGSAAGPLGPSVPAPHAGVVMVGVAGGPVAPTGVMGHFDQAQAPMPGPATDGTAERPTGPIAPVAYASVGRRFGALLIDGLCQGLVMAVAYVALLAGLGSAAFLILFLVLTIGFLVLLIVMAAAGSSPGKKVLSIRVVRAGDGAAPGLGLGFGRLLLRGLLLGVTLYIAGLSPWWDSSRRKRAWWDAATDTIVIGQTSVIRQLPTPDSSAVPISAVRTTPTWSDKPIAQPRTEEPLDHRASMPQPDNSVSDVSWNIGSKASGGGVISGIPGVPSAAKSTEIDHTRLARPLHPVTPPPQPVERVWFLVMDNGESIALAGPILIGRDPAADPGEQAALNKLGDETRSVSKTHLRVELGENGVVVTDRHSTNGVAVVTAGVAVACLPGEPTFVPPGSTVRFGDREFRVQQR